LFHADGRTDMTKLIVAFRNLLTRLTGRQKSYIHKFDDLLAIKHVGLQALIYSP
jgi:hypothetical protein